MLSHYRKLTYSLIFTLIKFVFRLISLTKEYFYSSEVPVLSISIKQLLRGCFFFVPNVAYRPSKHSALVIKNKEQYIRILGIQLASKFQKFRCIMVWVLGGLVIYHKMKTPKIRHNWARNEKFNICMYRIDRRNCMGLKADFMRIVQNFQPPTR